MERWPRIAELIESFGMSYELSADMDTPLDRQLVARLEAEPPSAYNAIAGIGGDGTHSALINALMRYRSAHPERRLPPYAFIPMGTGNDIAKSFGLAAREDFFSSDLRRCIATIVYGADYRMDLGVIGGRYFADALAIGVDSRILTERNIKKRRIERIPVLRSIVKGTFLYAMSLSPLLLKHKPVDARITVDGEEMYSGSIMNLLVKNTRIYGGGFDFCSNTYSNDGLLDVVLFTGHRDYLTGYLFAMRQNPQKVRSMATRINRGVRHVQGKNISIHLARSESAQIDGEEVPPSDAFEIAVAPAAIHIKTPAEP